MQKEDIIKPGSMRQIHVRDGETIGQAITREDGILSAKKQEPARVELLHEAAKITGVDRQAIYGHPARQLAFAQRLIDMVENQGGHRFSPGHRNAIALALTKISRMVCSPDADVHRDNYLDAAAYLAIAYECEVTAREFAANNQASGNKE